MRAKRRAAAGIATSIDVAAVPNGHNAVLEHMSARCVAPPVLTIVSGEIAVSANPAHPGQSGTQGPPPLEDWARHPLLFQTAYSGSSNVYVASQQAVLRVNAPMGRVMFFGEFINPSSSSAAITCLVSISGYIEKQ